MSYAIRIGPMKSRDGKPGYHYVALVDEGEREGVVASVIEADDLTGLRGLLAAPNVQPLVCAPELAEAAAALGLPTGPPQNPEVTGWWRHGLTMATVLGSLVDTKDLYRLVDFELAAAELERGIGARAESALEGFRVKITGDADFDCAAALMIFNSQPRVFVFRTVAQMSHWRLMVDGCLDAPKNNLLVLGDQDSPPYLASTLEWAELQRLYLPVSAVDDVPQVVSEADLVLLTGVIEAVGRRGNAERSMIEVPLSGGQLQVELERVPEEPPRPLQAPASA